MLSIVVAIVLFLQSIPWCIFQSFFPSLSISLHVITHTITQMIPCILNSFHFLEPINHTPILRLSLANIRKFWKENRHCQNFTQYTVLYVRKTVLAYRDRPNQTSDFQIEYLTNASMGVDPWVDWGTFLPYFLEWRGRLVFCPLLFLGYTFFVLMHTAFIG